jgi:hypothetical protein
VPILSGLDLFLYIMFATSFLISSFYFGFSEREYAPVLARIFGYAAFGNILFQVLVRS